MSALGIGYVCCFIGAGRAHERERERESGYISCQDDFTYVQTANKIKTTKSKCLIITSA